jgi:fluoride exporter
VKPILLIALAGGLGCVARYKVGALVLHHAVAWKFPAGTFAVNVAGCFLAGLLIGLAENHDFLTADMRLLLFTGFLGGFTTFSAFGVETVALLQRGDFAIAAGYVASSVICGLAALWGAVKLGGFAN